VKDSKETDFRAEMFSVGGNGEQRIGRGTEKNVIDDPLVLQGDLGNPLRHGKNNMKVSNVEKFGLSVFEPLGACQGLAFGTVPVRAGVVPDALVAAPVADLDVSVSDGCGPVARQSHLAGAGFGGS
jgi:hypothetical protein